MKVEFYSGFSREEKPIALIDGRRRLTIIQVLFEERIGSLLPEGGYHRLFRVETQDGAQWTLREAPQTADGWEVERVL